MSRWIRKTGTCDICQEVKELGKSTACPECRRVQQDISFLHTKCRGCREDRPEVREQLIAAHAARVEQHLVGDEWPHQTYGVQRVLDIMRAGGRRILVATPTGGGKSAMMRMLIEELSDKKFSVYTNRRMLLEQTSGNMTIDHGIRAAGHKPEYFHRVQVAMMQSEFVGLDKKLWHNADVVVIDEAHLQAGGSARAVINRHRENGATIIGFTATPIDLGDMYDTLVIAGKTSELRACGALVKALHFGPDEPDLRSIGRVPLGEDLTEKQNVKAIMVHGVFGRVLKHYQELNPQQRPSILFAPGVKESIWFAEQFNEAGIRAAHIDGDECWLDGELHPNTASIREDIMGGSQDGSIKVICNRFVLREGIDCLDSETEILTVDGWKRIGTINKGDIVHNLNMDTGEMELNLVDRCVSREVADGEMMLTIKSQHMDIRVTEGHLFHFKYSDPNTKERSVNWITKSAKELFARKSDYHLPISAVQHYTGVNLSDDELRLIAWFMADGGFGGKANPDCLSICQSKEYHHEIRDLLTRLGLSFRERVRKPSSGTFPNAKTCYEFMIPKGNRTGSLARSGWIQYSEYLDKRGSRLLLKMTRRQFKVFWDELMKGDGGNFDGNNSGTLHCNLKSQADLYMQLAVTRGFASHCYTYTTPNSVEMYAVRVRDEQWISSRPSDPRSARMTFEPATPGELVWCITTHNGTIVTRRNGTVSILGNCPWLEHGIFATVFGSLQSCLQSGGRMLRASPKTGKTHCTIQDHGGNWHRHGSLNADREWELHYTAAMYSGQWQEKCRGGSEPFRCPKCSQILANLKCPCGFVLDIKQRSRMVVQADGRLVQHRGEVHKPIKYADPVDATTKAWKSIYWRAKKSKKGMTFTQAFGLFAKENGGRYPPADLPLMPKKLVDTHRLVSNVPQSELR